MEAMANANGLQNVEMALYHSFTVVSGPQTLSSSPTVIGEKEEGRGGGLNKQLQRFSPYCAHKPESGLWTRD